MTSIKLIKACLPNIYRFNSRFLKIGVGEPICIGSVNGVLRRHATTKVEKKSEEVTKFTGSDAAKWKSKQTFGKKDPADHRPKIEGNVFLLCLGVILIYFCYLREENDLDDELKKDLMDRVPQLRTQHEIHLKTLAKVEEERALMKK